MASSTLEVAEIFRRYGEAYRAHHALSRTQRRAMAAIEQCRTAALGGHLYRCDHCGREHPVYNSCRNRHCPKCQGLDRAEWLAARMEDLLPVDYFHVVFTVPDSLHPLFLANPERLYDLLFLAAEQTLQELASNRRHLGARLGILAVLHTWTQTLRFHPHVHLIVTGGGLAPDGSRWVSARPGFLFPIPVLRSLFRGKLLAGLKALHHSGQLRLAGSLAELADALRFGALLAPLYDRDWVVYVKPPFAGPETVLTYLGRYTHRIAISNQRLVGLDGDDVLFRYKDRAAEDRWKIQRLPALEFIRRFLLHVLPERFVRIRYYGLLAHRNRRRDLERCRALLAAPAGGRSPESPRRAGSSACCGSPASTPLSVPIAAAAACSRSSRFQPSAGTSLLAVHHEPLPLDRQRSRPARLRRVPGRRPSRERPPVVQSDQRATSKPSSSPDRSPPGPPAALRQRLAA